MASAGVEPLTGSYAYRLSNNLIDLALMTLAEEWISISNSPSALVVKLSSTSAQGYVEQVPQFQIRRVGHSL